MQLDPSRFTRRSYLALAGASVVGLTGCQGDDGQQASHTAEPTASDTPANGGTATGAPTDSATATDTSANSETATDTSANSETATATEAAGAFPVPPNATESELRYVTEGSTRDGGRNDRLTDLLFYVTAPAEVTLQGYEVDSAGQTLTWYDENARGWSLEREEQVRVTGSFAVDEMVPDRARGGGGLRGRPNADRRYRAGDRGAFVWAFGRQTRQGSSPHTLVVGTGPWSSIVAVTVDTPKRPLERDSLPKFLTSNVCDFEYVDRVSRFRSSYGHSHTADFESCRTNKHYIEGEGMDNVPRFAPVSGTIHQIRQDGEIDVQTYIVPDDYPAFVVRQEHLLLDDGIEVGSHVAAGDRLGEWNEAEGAGTTAHATAGEIIIHMRTPEGTALVSYFDVLSDEAFGEWADAGGPDSRQDYVIPKEIRDANPNECGDDEFYEEEVTIDGYQTWVELE